MNIYNCFSQISCTLITHMHKYMYIKHHTHYFHSTHSSYAHTL